MNTTQYVAYLRRSKKEQASTLGLEAQEADVKRYVQLNNGEIINTYIEIESGTRKAYNKRTIIHQAINECIEKNATLIIAKLDRLARDVEFTSRLMNTRVKFIACDLPTANEFTIHIMAAVAEQEAKRISERTISALNAKKKRGEPLGFHAHKTRSGCPFNDEHRKKAVKIRRDQAQNNLNNLRGRSYAMALYDAGLTYEQIAIKMNAEGYKSSQNKPISKSTVCRWINNFTKSGRPRVRSKNYTHTSH